MHPAGAIKCIGRSQPERKVLWIWEETGHTGKTFLGEYLCIHRNAFLVTGGKHADIAFAYNLERTVVFDFARDQSERVPYQLLEAFKNGYIFSPKYQSCTKRFEPARVIVFANFAPDESKLSADRWDIRYIGEGGPPGVPPVQVVSALGGLAPPAGERLVIPSIRDID